jgi:hypothetical protein
MAKALELRRLDVGLITSFTPCGSAASMPLYVELCFGVQLGTT